MIRIRIGFLRTHRNIQIQPENKKGRTDLYKIGDTVYTNDYRNSKSPIWIKGIISEILGKRTYIVKVEEGLMRERQNNFSLCRA